MLGGQYITVSIQCAKERTGQDFPVPGKSTGVPSWALRWIKEIQNVIWCQTGSQATTADVAESELNIQDWVGQRGQCDIMSEAELFEPHLIPG